MSAPPETAGPPIESRDQLVADLERGCKPKSDWRIGTEHEKFGFTTDDLKPLPYFGERGIGALLNGLADELGWRAIREGNNTIALKAPSDCPSGGGSITLEPGGQLELSGAPLETLHETCAEVNRHLACVKRVARPLGVGMLGLGFQPLASRADIAWMPKGRYKIMGNYMPKRGSLGLDMMLRTCTVQTNLDFSSEADMVLKFRTSLALQPIATALFANSPFTEGEPNGFLSFRSHIWTDTDPDRCGMLPFVFEDGMGFERWVDYVLDVPMYFVYREGKYLDVSGQSFRDFLEGRLPGLPGEKPTMTDWTDHMTTPFPEVRLKHFLEMRGADGGRWQSICALPAYWVGLLYDADALQAAWDLVKDWTIQDHDALRAEVPRRGLEAEVAGRSVREIARDTLEIARVGLERRAFQDSGGDDETHFLDELDEIVETGETPADTKLRKFREEWDGQVEPVFRHYAY